MMTLLSGCLKHPPALDELRQLFSIYFSGYVLPQLTEFYPMHVWLSV